jgi:hypothetical protein
MSMNLDMAVKRGNETLQQVLESIVAGINSGDLESLSRSTSAAPPSQPSPGS